MSAPRLCFAVALFCCVAGLCCCARLQRESASSPEFTASVVEPSAAARIEINSASASELTRLPGVGSGLAARIVAYRAEHGPFRRVEHLMMVRGISEKKFRALQPYIEVK